MLTVTCNLEGANTRVKIYSGVTLITESVLNSVLPLTNTTDGYIIGEYYNGNWNYDGVMDGIYIYNVALTDAQIADRWNGGAGSLTHPTGITEATDVIAKIDFNENTGTLSDNNCTLGAGFDVTWSTGVTWVDGLMGVTSGSVGVYALAFPPDVITEIDGSIQFTHRWDEGTIVEPHPHWTAADLTVGNVVWKLEYLWINVTDSAVGVNTTIVEEVVATDGTHQATNVPAAGIDGTGKKISSIMQYRFWRDGTDVRDTYAGKVFMSEFDVHIKINSLGSRSTWVK